MIEWKPSPWKPALISALAALAVYAVTLAGTYVYDDRYIVQADARLGDVSRWREYWTKDYFNGGADNLYRPLVSMSYALQSKLHGSDEAHAWAFHLVNILLHGAVSAAVAELARRMMRSSTVAVVAGLLFAVHPIHVEAVANIVGRAELMCALGMILALVLFLRPLTTARAVAIWLCFLLALLSKEQGMLVPVFLLLAIPLRDFATVGARLVSPASTLVPGETSPTATSAADPIIPYAQPDTPRIGRLSGPTLTLILLLLWTVAGYILFRERILKFWWDRSFLDPMINPILLARGVDRWLLPFDFLGRYVALLVAPIRQSPDYGGAVIGWHVPFADPYLHLGLATAMASAVACVFAFLKRSWTMLFGILSTALLFGMVSNLPTIIGVNFAERLMYIPSAFVCIMLAAGAVRLPRRMFIAVFAIVISLFSLRTAVYAWEWNDRLRFYRYSVAHWPESVRLNLLLAEEYAERGDFTSASIVIASARDLQPDYYKVWIRSATIAMQAGRLDEAMRFARRAHKLQPSMTSTQLIGDISAKLRATAATTRSTQEASMSTQPATMPTQSPR